MSLREMARRAGLVAGSRVGAAEAQAATYSAAAAGAYLALARADTAGALRRVSALPDSLCELCAAPRLVHARLLASRGRLREASAILADRPTVLPSAIDVLWALERARVAERLGGQANARLGYAVVVNAWRGADGALGPIVNESRGALRRLAR